MHYILADNEICMNIFQFLEPDELALCMLACRVWYNVLYAREAPWALAYRWLVARDDTSGSAPYRLPSEDHGERHDANPPRAHMYKAAWLEKVADVYPMLHGEGVEIQDFVMNRFTCRSGHTASVIHNEVLVLYGGASHFFIFLHTLDAFHVGNEQMLALKEKPYGQCPTARWLHTACTINSHIYIFGGQSDFGFENDLFRFDVTYTEYAHAFTGPDGTSGAGCPGLRVTSDRLEPRISGPHGPCPRAGHSAVCIDECRILVFGGMTVAQVVLNDAYELDVEALLWKETVTSGVPPCGRWCHSTQLVGREMLVFGGWVYTLGAHHVFLNDLLALNVDTLTWTSVQCTGGPPRPRCQAPCFHVAGLPHQGWGSRGYLCMYGGACHGSSQDAALFNRLVVDYDDFCILDLDTLVWLPVKCSFPRYRGGVNAVVRYHDGWLLSGGMHSDPNGHAPRFKNDVVFVNVNVGGRLKVQYECMWSCLYTNTNYSSSP